MIRFGKTLLVIILAVGCLTTCKRNPFKVRISLKKSDIEIKRLEKDLFNPDPLSINENLPFLKEKYGGFLQLFSYVINAGDISDPAFGSLLIDFCTDKLNNEVYAKTMEVYPQLSDLEKQMEDAFRYFRYYFPEKKIPAIYSCITGFNSSIITGDSVLGIGLDKYLGADCEYYPRLGIYSYLYARMTPMHIAPDAIYAWGASEWEFTSMDYPDDNVLSEMIHEGKLRYFTRCILPDLPDELIFGFTSAQVKFCRNNEDLMWQYLVEHDLIFNTDQFVIRKLVGEAPFTSYFSNESPGRAAVWTGFRIVESYMKRNRDASLESLMNNVNVQEILEKARYNP
jgi:hypothetical protein